MVCAREVAWLESGVSKARAASRHALAEKPEKRELHAKFAFIRGFRVRAQRGRSEIARRGTHNTHGRGHFHGCLGGR